MEKPVYSGSYSGNVITFNFSRNYAEQTEGIVKGNYLQPFSNNLFMGESGKLNLLLLESVRNSLYARVSSQIPPEVRNDVHFHLFETLYLGRFELST